RQSRSWRYRSSPPLATDASSIWSATLRTPGASASVRRRRRGIGFGAHDPALLRDLPYPREAVSRVQLPRPCVQIGATLQRSMLGPLRIGLDDDAACPPDLVERRRAIGAASRFCTGWLPPRQEAHHSTGQSTFLRVVRTLPMAEHPYVRF